MQSGTGQRKARPEGGETASVASSSSRIRSCFCALRGQRFRGEARIRRERTLARLRSACSTGSPRDCRCRKSANGETLIGVDLPSPRPPLAQAAKRHQRRPEARAIRRAWGVIPGLAVRRIARGRESIFSIVAGLRALPHDSRDPVYSDKMRATRQTGGDLRRKPLRRLRRCRLADRERGLRLCWRNRALARVR